ncbi:hypothetical protein, partial [Paracoccus fistulariae]|uniref:hypothetical protein n=1 Tax=Paracoccus fistulariae TaxID=658446 RepID=UPI00362857CD
VVNVTNRADVNVRFRTFKLCLCHLGLLIAGRRDGPDECAPRFISGFGKNQGWQTPIPFAFICVSAELVAESAGNPRAKRVVQQRMQWDDPYSGILTEVEI